MTTIIAYANIQQPFPFHEIPNELVPEKLIITPNHQYHRVQQRHQCRRLAHFLLWKLLRITGKNTSLLGNIERTKSGRPYFPNETIDFNISHSADWVAVVLDINRREQSTVGIDIECPRPRDFLALMKHFASQDELAWFEQQSCSKLTFYRCWCLREAILKSQGVGIAKLSEVHHFPHAQKIFSEHCPQGRIFFTGELPFYLAAFVNQRQNQPHFFHWEGNTLVPQKHLPLMHYDVN
ncbi:MULTISPECIES: 4'-phosphopantetheinyl transferase superfamily protein [unclassified Pasteurella]|uniref:4'-phosphopantetheinyl transferase family protein n=1 Tax=unclassified Pasteurella TaxID=2621516 RepID=UPI001074029E|nr:4'-phosphopantetheinyl transferase superfamily protein [Pasteurella sp. 19428wF3_WM03]TFU52929.1 4'-phosphopantetheinyl transferase superfamily protein [Pasteurella sp. WM03]